MSTGSKKLLKGLHALKVTSCSEKSKEQYRHFIVCTEKQQMTEYMYIGAVSVLLIS